MLTKRELCVCVCVRVCVWELCTIAQFFYKLKTVLKHKVY